MEPNARPEPEKKWRRARNALIVLYLIFAGMGMATAAFNGFSVQATSELFLGIGTGCLSGLAVLIAERFTTH